MPAGVGNSTLLYRSSYYSEVATEFSPAIGALAASSTFVPASFASGPAHTRTKRLKSVLVIDRDAVGEWIRVRGVLRDDTWLSTGNKLTPTFQTAA